MKSALFTDFYELTMAQGFWKLRKTETAVFEAFFRRNPFEGGFTVFAGIATLLEDLEALHFDSEDIDYLDGIGIFDRDFLDFLAGFRFSGDVYAVREGELVFPQATLVRIQTDLVSAQIVEGLVLNRINFQSLIATKAARIWRASKYGRILEFGLRRAQGPDGALSASRAAAIGGAEATSNTLAGRIFNIPVMGTMAHSWVMAFASEEEAFARYAELYPARSVFLIDTYETMGSGIDNALKAAKALGGAPFGVRLDSGDIDYLSRMVRAKLDAHGFSNAYIVVSNELDEGIIEALVLRNAPVDIWGVGTALVTGGKESALAGVYKLAAVERGNGFAPTMKFSDDPEKSSNPGIKQVWRLYDDKDQPAADLMALEDESLDAAQELRIYHPSGDWRHITIAASRIEPMLHRVMFKGKSLLAHEELAEIRSRLAASLEKFDPTCLRLLNPHRYKVSISEKVRNIKLDLILQQHKNGNTKTLRRMGDV